MVKYGKRIVLVFLYAMYKTQRKSDVILLIIINQFPWLVMQRISSFFKQFCLEKCLRVVGFVKLGDLYANIPFNCF